MNKQLDKLGQDLVLCMVSSISTAIVLLVNCSLVVGLLCSFGILATVFGTYFSWRRIMKKSQTEEKVTVIYDDWGSR